MPNPGYNFNIFNLINNRYGSLSYEAGKKFGKEVHQHSKAETTPYVQP